MQKILRKRVWRDLKDNIFRYLALCLLIVLGMYLIVSLVGAAETVISGVDEKAEQNRLEDGQFRVFVPLTEQEEKLLEAKGITLEKMFYIDFDLQDSSTLRLFQKREKIDLIDLDEGRLPEKEGETVLEKRYCEEQDISTGDQITIGGQALRVVGIGTVPDYDAVFENLSDSSVDSKQFGLAFVNAKNYDSLRNTGKSTRSEEYVYAYRLNGKMTDEELKKELKEFSFSPESVEDPYFQQYWEETAGKKEELENGIRELSDGSRKLNEALGELSANNKTLQAGAGKILDSYLREANEGLASYGLPQELTEDNFEEILTGLTESSDSAIMGIKLGMIKSQLEELKSYKDGVTEYTGGVGKSAEGAEELEEGMQKLQDNSEALLDTYFEEDISNLTQFLTVDRNPRAKASADDQVINKIAGLIAGVIVMVLFTYVISVFVIHGIEKESSVIGSLYALGVRRRELMAHYLMLPVTVTFLAGAAGTAIGYSSWGIAVQMGDCYNYFSVPVLQTAYPAYLLVYGILMPPLAAAAVNCIVIRKKLSSPALKLIRNEQKNSRISHINLGKMGFTGRFQIRQMLREMRTGFTVLFGMFIALLIMMLGLNCYVMCIHISKENKTDAKYEYMYTYKYPEQQIPEGGEACFAKTLNKEIYGYDLEVTVLGIEKDNPYFDAGVNEGSTNRVTVSSAMAQKYGLTQGDQLILTDEEAERNYAFTVESVTQYSTGFYVFMDIDSMRELFGESEDYYNVVLSDQELDIEPGRLYAAFSREDITNSADIFVSMMMPMIYMLTGVSGLIFCVVMYLMMKVMIDRSAFSISLIKVFGYRTGEIRRLYLNGNFYVVAVSAAICIPLSKKLMDMMYPLLVSNVSCAMNLTFSWQGYLGIYAAIIALYFIINQLLVRRLNKVTPAEVLKNRE